MKGSHKFALVAALTAFAGSPAWAQNASLIVSSATSQIGFAASNLQVPVAYGARWGTFGIGAYAQGVDYTEDKVDGSAGFAFGLGDPDDTAALEIAVVTSSLFGGSGSGDSFGDSGALGFKLHTNVPGNAAIAFGVNGTARWGSDYFTDNNRSSVYAVVSKMVPVGQFATILNLGLGDGVYSPIDHSGGSIFGSAAFYFTSQISLIAEYTGRFANAAVSVAPFKSLGLTLTVGASNLSERYDADTELAGSVGWGFAFY